MFKNVIRNGLSPEVWSSEEEVREGEETVEELLEGEDSKEGEVVDWLEEGDPKAVAFREKYVFSAFLSCFGSAQQLLARDTRKPDPDVALLCIFEQDENVVLPCPLVRAQAG